MHLLLASRVSWWIVIVKGQPPAVYRNTLHLLCITVPIRAPSIPPCAPTPLSSPVPLLPRPLAVPPPSPHSPAAAAAAAAVPARRPSRSASASPRSPAPSPCAT